jgi:hypothetical protein
VDFFAVTVTHPKGSRRETPVMTSDTRFHIRRREGALARLQGLTATAAVAGVAGTAVFGAVAAASWSGNPTAKSAADVRAGDSGDDQGAQQPAATPRTRTDPNDIFGSNPNTGANGGGSARIQPAIPRQGRAHATTGGSG